MDGGADGDADGDSDADVGGDGDVDGDGDGDGDADADGDGDCDPEAGWALESVTDLGSYPSVAVASDGALDVSFIGDDGVTFGTNASGDWTFDVLDPAETLSSIVLDADEVPTVFYSSVDLSELWVTRLEDGEWSAERVDSSGQRLSYVAAVVDGAGSLHEIALELDAPARVRYATNESGGWDASDADFPESSGAFCASILAAEDGSLHAAVGLAGQIWGLHLVGGAWTSELVESSGNVSACAIRTGDDGSLQVLYEDQSLDARLATYDGAEWQAETIPLDGGSWLSGLAETTDGALHFAMGRDLGQGTGELVYATNASGVWDDEALADFRGADPRLVVHGNVLHVVSWDYDTVELWHASRCLP